MAEYNYDEENSAKNLIGKALRKTNPTISDDTIDAIYTKTQGALKQQNIDLDTLPASAASSVALGLMNLPAKQTTLVDTVLPSPWKGTVAEQRSPSAPSAKSLDTFDPEAVKKAYAEMADKYNANLPAKIASNMFAAQVSPELLSQTNKTWDTAARLPIEQLGAQQKASTEGLAAAKSIQDIEKTAGEYKTSQMKKKEEITSAELDNVVKQLTTDQQVRLNKSDSPETIMAKQLILAQMASIPEVNKAELKKIISDPSVTAMQLMPAMATYAPAAMNAYIGKLTASKTAAETGSIQASTGKTYAETGGVQASTGKTLAETPGVAAESQIKTGTANKIAPSAQQEANRDALRIIRSEYDKEQDPEKKAGLFREMMRLSKEVGPILKTDGSLATVSAGGVTIPPNPADVAVAEGAGQAKVKFNERNREYKTAVEPQLDAVLKKLDSVKAGKGTETYARLMPANEQQDLVNMLAQANNYYPGALPQDMAARVTAAQKDPTRLSGSLVSSMTNEQIRNTINRIKSIAQNDINYQNQLDAAEKKLGQGNFAKTQTAGPKPKDISSYPPNNSKGWTLKVDGKGNAAYVSPDGKDYEEVK